MDVMRQQLYESENWGQSTVDVFGSQKAKTAVWGDTVLWFSEEAGKGHMFDNWGKAWVNADALYPWKVARATWWKTLEKGSVCTDNFRLSAEV